MRAALLNRLPACFSLLCLLLPASGAFGQYTLKEMTTPPPAELKEAMHSLLEAKSVQVFDAKGKLLCEVWFAKSVPVKASSDKVQKGLTYRDVEPSMVLGAIRFPQPVQDYRKQDVPAGVYTLRIASQPQDGDHMGTAPHPEFCLLVAAKLDETPDLLKPKKLNDLSGKSIDGSHPAGLLLFPYPKPEPTPKLADQGMGHWVIKRVIQAQVNGKPAPLGIGLTVVGFSSAI